MGADVALVINNSLTCMTNFFKFPRLMLKDQEKKQSGPKRTQMVRGKDGRTKSSPARHTVGCAMGFLSSNNYNLLYLWHLGIL